jgi:hypothetical protein
MDLLIKKKKKKEGKIAIRQLSCFLMKRWNLKPFALTTEGHSSQWGH